MERIYNKLVRDKIPEIIRNNGEESVTSVLSDNQYKEELYKKLLEEANEVINSQNPDETIEEVADAFEVLRAIAELNNKKIDDVIKIADQKKLKRGGFEKRIFLEKVYSKDDIKE